MLLKGCNCQSCEVERTVIRTKTDTLYLPPDTASVRITAKPKPRRVLPYKPAHNDTALQPLAECLDTVEYCDEYYEKDNYRAYVYETVVGNRIVDRQITWYNLKPREVIITTKEIERTISAKEGIRVYGGAMLGYSNRYAANIQRFSVGPSVAITIPQGLGISYSFDALNNGHAINLLYKIKLKK